MRGWVVGLLAAGLDGVVDVRFGVGGHVDLRIVVFVIHRPVVRMIMLLSSTNPVHSAPNGLEVTCVYWLLLLVGCRDG